MLKFLASVFILLSFTSCGVDTSSSTQTAKVEESTGTDTGTDALMPPPLVELNPIADANSTVPDDGTIDPGDGTTDPGDGTTDPGDGGNQASSDYDVEGAILDPFGCYLGDVNNGYTNNVLKDNSNDYLGAMDLEDGLGITSRYAYSEDVSKSEVILYYYDLLPVRTLKVMSVLGYKNTLSIDTAWADNDKKVIYVRTPKDENDFYGCYRYDLSLVDVDDGVTITKVYRLKE